MIFLLVLLLIAAVSLFLVTPSLRHREMKRFSASPIAHRGVHDDPAVDENSLTSFRIAAERGLGSELDVRLTSDGVPVVMHDAALSRMCGIDRFVSDMTLDELKQCRLLVSGECVPTLAEVTRLTAGRVPLVIELKGEGRDRIAERTAEVLRTYEGEYAVESFNPLICTGTGKSPRM